MLALVTATRNSISTLPNTLKSVAAISDQIRQVFVDGNSTDGTLEYLQEYASRNHNAFVLTQVGRGLYQALNQALQVICEDSSISYIGLLHSDDRVITENYRRYIATIQQTNAEIFYSDIETHDSTGKITRRWIAGRFSSFKLNTGWMPPHTSMIVARSVYQEMGLYDPSFGTAADYEWIVRILSEKNHRISYFPHRTISMRTGGASNASVAARIRANAMDSRVWHKKSRAQAAVIRILKPLRKTGQFLSP